MKKFKSVDDLIDQLKPVNPVYCIRKKTINPFFSMALANLSLNGLSSSTMSSDFPLKSEKSLFFSLIICNLIYVHNLWIQ